MAAPSQNITRSRIPPATQANYFRYFSLRMCGALELVCGALKPGAFEPQLKGVGSCSSMHYRVMKHERSLENTKEA